MAISMMDEYECDRQIWCDRAAVRRRQVPGGRDGGLHCEETGTRALQLRSIGRTVEATVQMLVHS